ncbi:MAG: hypothetical protein HY290_20350 [Planctomycetia bacterium]|nr:hypothetical protein [Planctomycetia bacterium]
MCISKPYFFAVLACLWAALSQPVWSQEYEHEPIRYSKSDPHNRVSQLIERLESGQARLQYDGKMGYLRSLLNELSVPVSSQTLVFSKTSLQRHRIAPQSPRGLYFSDDVYVGFCQQGDVLELSAVDPNLGTVFYTLDQNPAGPPRIVRQADNCLICHSSSQTKDVPGHLVRSVMTDTAGFPILSAGTYRIEHTSPLEKRWGGWYVTGTHGPQKHLGNLTIEGNQVPREIDNQAGMNLKELGDRIPSDRYLSAHSDIVALMVLEHQTEAQNLIARSNFLTRQALHYQQALNRELHEPEDHVWESTKSRIKSAGEPLVEYLLFCDEAELTHRIQGTSGFANEFAQIGPRDRHGRSLRDFDLETRMFKYRCSYLIYSPSFRELPATARDYVMRRLWEVLSGQDQSPKFAHLPAQERQAILEILRDTLPDLPDCWRAEPGT